RCGDGIPQAGEQCDDGNAVNNDACTNTCTTPRCGDGIPQAGEQCDDGNASNFDACTTSCRTAACGDGYLQPGETCDDGNNANNDGCNAACQPEYCGDGVTQPGEQCDDGNNASGDGCSGGCLVEDCPPDLGDASAFNVFAFTSYTGGMDVEGRAAAGTLLSMSGFNLNYGTPGGVAGVAGDRLELSYGVVHGHAAYGATAAITGVTFDGGAAHHASPLDFPAVEADVTAFADRLCDLSANGATAMGPGGALTLGGGDATLDVFDVSAAQIASATSLDVTAPASATVVVNLRGASLDISGFSVRLHGVHRSRVLFNACDATAVDVYAIALQGSLLAPWADVTFSNGDLYGQLIAYSVDGPGEVHLPGFDGVVPCTFCGDGLIDAGEACDDGNVVSGDGCTTSCDAEYCGDGVRQPAEGCDDGNVSDGDGCASDCTVERHGACGDGALDQGEGCDDGNLTNGDGCSATCFPEACVSDLGPAGYFNLFSRTTYTGGHHVGGPVAAVDAVDMEGFEVGWQTPGSPAMYADALDLSWGTLHGRAYWGSALGGSGVDFPDGGGFVHATPFSLTAAGGRAEQFSTLLWLVPATGTTSFQYGTLTLTGARPGVNVFTVDAAWLAAAHTLNIDVPPGAAAIVNVQGASASMMNMGIFLHGGTAARTIYNFYGTTRLDLAGVGVPGTILAPWADVTFDNGSQLGLLVGWSVTGSAELYHRPLTWTLDCAAWEAMRAARVAAGTWPWP
ncbi:MAG TPA: choice-of-anchor A family protein, partial [Myxococcota bacterium]|nr:choice-of-anchor A family protein [Myxococcota bacterium]